MASGDNDGRVSPERLSEICAELEEMLDRAREGGDLTLEVKASVAQSVVVYSLAQYSVSAAQTALRIWVGGNRLMAMPLVRAAWESAVTAVWVAQSKSGAQALQNEGERQRAAKLKEAMASAMFSLGVTPVVSPPLPSGWDKAGSVLRDRFQALEGGSDLYLIYRALSSFCHAGVVLVDEYLYSDEDKYFLSSVAKLDDDNDPLMYPHLAVIAATWAVRAFDWFRPRKPDRSRIRVLASELGTSTELKLTARAHMNEQTKLSNRKAWKS